MIQAVHHATPGDICAIAHYEDFKKELSQARQKRKSKMEFAEAFQEILKVEGESFTDQPMDRGGPTKFGITIPALKEYGYRNPDRDSILALTKESASQIYRQLYWDKLNLNQIKSSAVQHILFDQAINRGPATAVIQIQKILATMLKVPVAVDGSLGPKTIVLINLCDAKNLVWAFFTASQISYCQIVEEDKTQSIFIKGWIARTHNLLAQAMEKL